MRELQVIAIKGIWHVKQLKCGEPDPFVMDLFDGEHVLPTPYLTSTPLEVVVAELRRLNPDALVTADPEDGAAP